MINKGKNTIFTRKKRGIRKEQCTITTHKNLSVKIDYISIVFETANEAGTLYNLLSHIIYNGLNMNKIESRPIEGREWEFRFFVDFEGNIDDPRVINALRGIEEESKKIKLLGNY